MALDAGLSAPARLEALSIAASARTAAVLAARLELSEGIATGTGTDCIAVASPAGAQQWCGLHTPQGRALAAAVYRAVHEGATQWMAETGGRAYPLD